MKNEDIKKRLGDEKQGLLIPKRVVSFLFIILFLLSIPLYGQIYLNGFVRYEEYPSLANSKEVYASFIDNDAESDFIVLSDSTWAAVHLSTKDYKPAYIKLPYPVSNIQKLSRDASGIICFFISRSNKLIGLIKIYDSGKYNLLDKLSFNSYPSDFSVYKKGNKNYVLVYGDNFNGLELVVIDNKKMSSINLVEKHLIKDAAFVDIDYDGLIDICYLDLIENKIKILLNNHRGGFELARAIGCAKLLESYSIIDYNFDGFFDLIYNFGNSLEISYGDSVSAFTDKKVLMEVENETIEKIRLADFNRDGYYDIAILVNSSSPVIRIAFSRQGYELDAPLDFYSGEIKDIDIAGYNPTALVFLAEDYIKVISQKEKINKIVIGLNPYTLYHFQDEDGFFVYDSVARCINFIRHNYKDIYPINISQHFNEMKYYKDDDGVLLYLYARGNRLLEIVSLNIENGNYRNTLIYSQIPVDDIIILPSSSRNYPKIVIVSYESDQLKAIEYYFKDIRYLSSKPKVLADSVLGFSSAGNTIFYLAREKSGELSLKAYNEVRSSTELINAGIILQEGNNFSISSFINKKNENIVILREGKNLVVIYKNKVKKIDPLVVEGGNKLLLASDKLDISYLYLWRDNKELYKIGSLENLKGNYRIDKISADVEGDFFVDFTKNNDEIIYNLDKSNGCITLIWKD